MASAPHLDDIEGSLNNLPEELNRNLTLMRDLDSKSKKVMVDIDKKTDDYISNIKNYSAEEMKETMASIQSKFDAAKNLSDDKVQISIQNYALVDKRIRHLDNAILKLEKRIQLNADIQEKALEAKRSLDLKKGDSKKKSPLTTARAVTNKSSKTKSLDNVAVETSCFSGGLVGTETTHSADVDMPIDPNEPTFCLCKRVSFGEMIACDNPDCAIEWFHFACVGLITKPKGKWFCSNCIKDRKKK